MTTFSWEDRLLAPEKTDPEQLLSEVADKLVIYLQEGQLSPRSFVQKLNLNIDSMEQLLRLHFIIKDKVVHFIQSLPDYIRQIKTSTLKVKRQHRNEVQGRIDWQTTINRRYQQNPGDKTTFVCEQTNKNFNIRENIVLKQLLAVIYDIIINDLDGKPENYSWLSDWLGNKNLAAGLEKLYFRNVYLNRIDLAEETVTDRMIQDTKRSCSVLYRRAAELLEFYREQVKREKWREDSSEIQELLQNTFLRPEKESVLFELYWIIKLLNCTWKQNEVNSNLELLEKGQNVVARWQKADKDYILYHDCGGSADLNWSVGLDDEFSAVENKYLQQRVEGLRAAKRISNIFSSGLQPSLWQGRPDLIVEVRDDSGQIQKVVIGEIKYTCRTETAKQGLKELMEYCQLIKYQDEYIKRKEIEVVGLLLVDGVQLSTEGTPLRAVRVTRDDSGGWREELKVSRDIEIK
jgi:hypothetical protein